MQMCRKHKRQKKMTGSKIEKPFIGCHSSHKHWHRNLPKQRGRGLEEPQPCTALLLREPKDVLSTHSSLQQENSKHFMEKQTTRICYSTAGVISRDFAEASQQYPREWSNSQGRAQKAQPAATAVPRPEPTHGCPWSCLIPVG